MKETLHPVYTRTGMIKYFLKGSLLLFAAGIVANLFHTLFSVFVPQVISFTVDSVIGSEEPSALFLFFARAFGGVDVLKENLWIMAVVIGVLALLIGLCHYLRTYLNARANQVLMRRMRDKLFSHIQRLPLGWHHANMTGDIIQRCTSDADTISNFISQQLVTLLRVVILTALSLAMMFVMSPKLALIAAAFIPIVVVYSVLFYKRAGKSFKVCDENEGILSTIAQENFSGVRVVRAFGRERFERDKFEKQNVYYTGLWVKIERFLAMYWATSDFVIALQLLVIVTLGTVFCVQGQLSSGRLIAFISYNTMLMDPVRQLGRIISNLSKAGVSIDRIADIMNAEEEHYGKKGQLKGDIVFENVSFGFSEDRLVLKDISFTIPEGSTLGIIGGTGSGKSTLVSLLDKFYPLSGGRITIGGTDLGELSPATLRGNIGLVLQEGYLYSRTVGENIGLAAGSSREEIERAAQTAGLHENVREFARGYDTIVGERGVTLSGGQKQRVAIARTILRKTPYYIFDDSLSAVDSDTDALIRANLKEECEGATVVLISHRIMTVMHADNIIVLEGGRIAESGTHEQLLRKGGLYQKIYEAQLSLPDEIKEAENV